jgi:two-component system LytT family sensor kinase
MKELINNPDKVKQIEFWAATAVLILSLLGLVIIVNEGGSVDLFIAHLVQYTIIYSTFLVLNFIIVPRFLEPSSAFLNSALIVLAYLLLVLAFLSTNNFTDSYNPNRDHYPLLNRSPFLQAYWVVLAFGLYFAIKYSIPNFSTPSVAADAKFKVIIRDGLVLYILWTVSLLLLAVSKAEGELIIAWGLIVPTAMLLYSGCYTYLIPATVNKKYPFIKFLLRIVLVLAIAFLPLSFFGIALTYDDDAGFALAGANVFFQFFITAPLSWWLFKRHIKGNEELYILKKELGRSTANFDFLRSQINPHFLFNALNTLYGTAIQESAERTSEGVQRLGDMMRFMLQENMQEKIAVVREIEYLNNYISLQRLRTDPIQSIKIESQIDDHPQLQQIAPMLLIPFVENAFKHGISFREPSHIKIALEIKDKTLNFDVYNSKHIKMQNDPEKDSSGIGLDNVKQRLLLLYPKRHELIIRETGKEFFVHLTIQLS